MSDPQKTRKIFLDELERSIISAAMKESKDAKPRRYDIRHIRSLFARLYDDLIHEPTNSQADVYHRLYRVRDVVIRPEWEFEPLLHLPGNALMRELDMRHRDAETVRNICNSIRNSTGHLSS